MTVLILLVGVACSASAPSGAPTATVGADDITGIVLTTVEARLAREATTTEGGTNPDETTAPALKEIEARLAQADATPAPTADVDAIAARVLAQVESQRQEKSNTDSSTYDNMAADGIADDLQEVLISLYERTNPAVVYIIVPPLGSGSGFVYDAEGYIGGTNHPGDGTAGW